MAQHQLVIKVKLNKIWRVGSKQSAWLFQCNAMWQGFIEPKKAMLAWPMLLGGLPLGQPLKYLGVSQPKCPFSHKDETINHCYCFVPKLRESGNGPQTCVVKDDNFTNLLFYKYMIQAITLRSRGNLGHLSPQ
jgi:hypothetical protein